MIDNDTKFMLAMHLSDSRTTLDVANVFKQGKDETTEKPEDVYVDGCVSYQSGFNKVLYDHHQSVKLHQKVGIRVRKTNSVVERLHVTLKEYKANERNGWNVHFMIDYLYINNKLTVPCRSLRIIKKKASYS